MHSQRSSGLTPSPVCTLKTFTQIQERGRVFFEVASTEENSAHEIGRESHKFKWKYNKFFSFPANFSACHCTFRVFSNKLRILRRLPQRLFLSRWILRVVGRRGDVPAATSPVDVYRFVRKSQTSDEKGMEHTDVLASLEFRVLLAGQHAEGVGTEVVPLPGSLA